MKFIKILGLAFFLIAILSQPGYAVSPEVTTDLHPMCYGVPSHLNPDDLKIRGETHSGSLKKYEGSYFLMPQNYKYGDKLIAFRIVYQGGDKDDCDKPYLVFLSGSKTVIEASMLFPIYDSKGNACVLVAYDWKRSDGVKLKSQSIFYSPKAGIKNGIAEIFILGSLSAEWLSDNEQYLKHRVVASNLTSNDNEGIDINIRNNNSVISTKIGNNKPPFDNIIREGLLAVIWSEALSDTENSVPPRNLIACVRDTPEHRKRIESRAACEAFLEGLVKAFVENMK